MINRIWLLLGYKAAKGSATIINQLNRECGHLSFGQAVNKLKRDAAAARVEAAHESAQRARERAIHEHKRAALRAWKEERRDSRNRLHLQEWSFGIAYYFLGFFVFFIGLHFLFSTIPNIVQYGLNADVTGIIAMSAVLFLFLLFRYLSRRAKRLLEPPDDLK
jgi:hypothetical protein